MAAATPTTLGEITLAGDFAGGVDGTFPELRATGVTPGVHGTIATATVDAKGRLTYIQKMTQAELDAAIEAAYLLHPEQYTIIDGKKVPILGTNTTIASTTTVGYAAGGSGIVVDNGQFSIPLADASTFGEVIVPTTSSFLIAGDGTISVDTSDQLPITGGEVKKQFQPDVDGSAIVNQSWNLPVSGSWGDSIVTPQMGYQTSSITLTNTAAFFSGVGTRSSGIMQASNGSRACVVYIDPFGAADNNNFKVIWTSATTTDGVNWQITKIPETAALYNSAYPGFPGGMVTDGTSFFMYGMFTSDTGSTGSPWSWWTAKSTDGLNWTFTTQTSTTYLLNGGIAWANGQFVVSGGSPSGPTTTIGYHTSNDGVTWSAAINTSISMISGNSTWFMAADGSNHYLIMSGSTSTARKILSRPAGTSTNFSDRSAAFPSAASIRLFATNGSGTAVVQIGTGALYYTTNAGAAWTLASSGTVIYDVIWWLGNKFMAFNSTASASSTTGASWTTSTTSIGVANFNIAGEPLRIGTTYFIPEGSRTLNVPMYPSRGYSRATSYLLTDNNGATFGIGNNTSQYGVGTVFPKGLIDRFNPNYGIPTTLNIEVSNQGTKYGYQHRIVVWATGRKFRINMITNTANVSTFVLKATEKDIIISEEPIVLLLTYIAANSWLSTKE